MSLQTENKLPWPEIRMEFFPTPEKETIATLWPDIRRFFSGKQGRFANYMVYLSTDLYGGFNLCSILRENKGESTFQDPVLVSPSEFPIVSLEKIWEICKNKEFEEMDREDWELLGYSFLFLGKFEDFGQWILLTEQYFSLSDDCLYLLNLVGWKSNFISQNNSVLCALAEYTIGNYKEENINLIVGALFNNGYWQVAGVLFSLIEKNILQGELSFRVWKFLIGLYSEFKDWEKEYFLQVSLGKIPAFSALRYAKKYLSSEEYLKYKSKLEQTYRGEWKADSEFGYNMEVELDPLFEIMNGYDAGGEDFFQQLIAKQKVMPYSYFANIMIAVVYFRKKEYNHFLEHYNLSGRLKYLPLPLSLYAKVQKHLGNHEIAEEINSAISSRQIVITLPNGWE